MALRRARCRNIPLIFLVPSKHSGCEKVVMLVVSVVVSRWLVWMVDGVAFGSRISEVDGSGESRRRGRDGDIYAVVVGVGESGDHAH